MSICRHFYPDELKCPDRTQISVPAVDACIFRATSKGAICALLRCAEPCPAVPRWPCGCARPSASSIGHVAPQGGAKHLARNMACACSCCDEAVRCCGASRAGVCWRIERHGHNNGACKHHPAENDMYHALLVICGPAATLTGTATAALPPALAKAVARISLGARAWRTCCDNSCAV